MCTATKKHSGNVERAATRSCLSFRGAERTGSCTHFHNDGWGKNSLKIYQPTNQKKNGTVTSLKRVFSVLLFVVKRSTVKSTLVKEEVKNWHAYKRLKQHYGISFNSKMVWHCRPLNQPPAWILPAMIILILVCTWPAGHLSIYINKPFWNEIHSYCFLFCHWRQQNRTKRLQTKNRHRIKVQSCYCMNYSTMSRLIVFHPTEYNIHDSKWWPQ